MTLADDLIEGAVVPNAPQRPCSVCKCLEEADPRAKAALEAALAGTIGRNRLAAILTNNGYPTTWRNIERHKKGHP